MIWLISDTHFGHSNIIKYCERPFKNVNEMDACMISKWNERVKPSDVVIHLGDFCMGNPEWYKNELNGIILLICGNHDSNVVGLIESGFIVSSKPIVFGNIVLSHYPLLDYELNGKLNIHGHIHERESFGNRVNVSVEHIHYKPVALLDVMDEVV